MNETQDFLARYCTTDSSELYHHGILGQKWGVRRYQNPDGSLTEEGRKRYYGGGSDFTEKGRKRYLRDTRSDIEEKRVKAAQAAFDKQQSVKELNKVASKTKKIESKRELTDKERNKMSQATTLAANFIASYDEKEKAYKNAVMKAKKEFGDTKIADLKMRDYNVGGNTQKMVGGTVVPLSAYITDTVLSAASIGLMVAGVTPIGVAMTPSETGTKRKNYIRQKNEYLLKYKHNDPSILYARYQS